MISSIFQIYLNIIRSCFPLSAVSFLSSRFPKKREVVKRQKRMPLLSGLGALPAKETSSAKQFPTRPKPK